MIFSSLSTTKSPIEWAFDFLYDKSQIDVVLSGMSDICQVKDNITYLNIAEIGMLSAIDIKMFIDAKHIYDTMSLVRCTGCSYCIPCSVS